MEIKIHLLIIEGSGSLQWWYDLVLLCTKRQNIRTGKLNQTKQKPFQIPLKYNKKKGINQSKSIQPMPTIHFKSKLSLRHFYKNSTEEYNIVSEISNKYTI